MLNVAGAESVIGGNACKSQVRTSDISQYLGLDGIEAGRRKAATPGQVSCIATRSEAKSNQVEQMLCDRMVGGCIELRPEALRRLDLMRQELGELAAYVQGACNSVVDVSAKAGKHSSRNTDAPTIAFRKLRQLGRLIGAHQRHLPRGKLDRPAVLARQQAGTGGQDQISIATRVVDKFGSSLHAHGCPVHDA